MKQQNKKTTFEIIIETIIKYRVSIIILLAALVIAVMVFTISNFIDISNNDKADRQYDQVQMSISELAGNTNSGERVDLIQQQMQSLMSIIQVYPRTVAAERARLFIARFYYESFFTSGNKQVLQTAYSNYNYAFLVARSDFYRALALIGRAQCSEQDNGYAKAFEDYNMVASKYTNQGFAPLALIGMARCREQMSDINGAINCYKQLIKEYPDSEWNYFARGKIYYYTENAAENSVSNQPANIFSPFLTPKP
jgi:tetratricopeptide (TPR) repeat protein